MLGQFFNVGTQMFILISGFLFGMKKIDNIQNWYKKRMKRIFVLYWIFLVVLLIIYTLTDIKYSLFHFILLVFGLQGSNIYILGAEQTWFISVILMCYLITPVLHKTIDYLNFKSKGYIYFIVIATMPVLFALFKSPAVYTLLSPVMLYIFGFIIGKYRSKLHINPWIAILIMILMFVCRIESKVLFDGTILYDRIVVVYTQSIIAICFLMLFLYYFDHKEPCKVVSFIDKYSFEIYLVHYMFIVGPVSLMKITSSWLINSLIVVLISFIGAVIIKNISNLIYRKLDK